MRGPGGEADDVLIDMSATPPVIENTGFVQSSRFDGDTLCQVFSAVESERQTAVLARATVSFEAAAAEDPAVGTSLVAFEQLHEGSVPTDEPVAVHEDIDDAAQTVSVETTSPEEPSTPGATDGHTSLPSTGGDAPVVLVGFAAGLLVLGALLVLYRRNQGVNRT